MDNGASSYRRFLQGDEAAFDEIMKDLFHPLVFFIDRYVHDVYIAEDIAIDVFSELIVHKHRYNFKVSLKTYLFMIGRSRALDFIKHRKIIELVPLESREPKDELTPWESLLSDERKLKLSHAIAALPVDMRTAVHLVFFEEMTYKEAGKVIKKSTKQVDNLLYRAKKELRIILEGDDLI